MYKKNLKIRWLAEMGTDLDNREVKYFVVINLYVYCKDKSDIIAKQIWTLLQELGSSEECFYSSRNPSFTGVWGCSHQEHFATLSTFLILQLCPKGACKKHL